MIKIIITEKQKNNIINHYREVNEGWLSKTIRGGKKNIRGSFGDSIHNKKESFIDDLLNIEDFIMKHNNNFVDYDKWDDVKMDLIGDAVSNNFNGIIEKVYSPSGSFKVVYKTNEKKIYDK
jgi:hypothetical protein